MIVDLLGWLARRSHRVAIALYERAHLDPYFSCEVPELHRGVRPALLHLGYELVSSLHRRLLDAPLRSLEHRREMAWGHDIYQRASREALFMRTSLPYRGALTTDDLPF